MLTHVEFRSDRFPPDPDEEKLINPELWGRRLAHFMRDGLRAKGYVIEDPIAEDWGWLLLIRNEKCRLSIGCGHYQEYDDGYLCFIEPHKPYVWKFLKRVDTRELIGALRQTMDEILTPGAGIHAKRWWTYEDFNLRY
jgi:hypothetical protein